MNKMIKKWKKIKTLETYLCGKFYKVEKDRVLTPGGVETDYYVVRKQPSVMVIPIDEERKIHMTMQHRYPNDKCKFEFPSGHMDANDGKKSIYRTAKRELEEETSLVAKGWHYLGVFDEANGISDIIDHILVAYDVKKKKSPEKILLTKIYTKVASLILKKSMK